MSDVQADRCKYLLPCGICDKTNKPCSENEPIVAYECDHELVFDECEYPGKPGWMTYKCRKCGEKIYYTFDR